MPFHLPFVASVRLLCIVCVRGPNRLAIDNAFAQGLVPDLGVLEFQLLIEILVKTTPKMTAISPQQINSPTIFVQSPLPPTESLAASLWNDQVSMSYSAKSKIPSQSSSLGVVALHIEFFRNDTCQIYNFAKEFQPRGVNPNVGTDLAHAKLVDAPYCYKLLKRAISALTA